MTYIKGHRNKRVFWVPDSVGESMVQSGHVLRASKAEFNKQRKAARTPTVDEGPKDAEETPTAAPPIDEEQEPAADEDTPTAAAPAGNASTEAWAAHALALGYSEEQVEGLGRDEIKSLVG